MEKKLINFIFSVSQIIFLTVVTTGAVFLEVYSEKKDSWRIFICYLIGAMILEWQICQYRKEALGKKTNSLWRYWFRDEVLDEED